MPNPSQQSLWKPLTVSKDSFKDKHAAKFIRAKDYKRIVYFFDCENIDFQSEKGEQIWSTKGDGQIEVPARVGVFVVQYSMMAANVSMDSSQWEVDHDMKRRCDRLLRHRIDSDGQVLYLVLWTPTWKYARMISNFNQVISAYEPG